MNNNINASNNHVTCNVIESHIDYFIADLETAGYAIRTLKKKRTALRQFISWRRCLKNPSAEPDESEVIDFLERSSHYGRNRRRTESAALLSFLEYLRSHSVIKTSPPKVLDNVSSLMERRYADFLSREKGLAELSIRVYLPLVHDLLHYLKREHGTTAVCRLNANILRAFLLERAGDRSSECVRLLSTSLRSFLRFLYAKGDIHHDLTAAIPMVRRWAQAGVPRKLTADEVDRVLDAPDQETAKGRRDYAILLLLAKLGLRSSEVISLELEDIHWRTGEILIRGKGSRLDLLPLPHEVGRAIARYLELDRGIRTTKRVFLRTNAPRVPLTGPASIGHIVRKFMTCADVERPKQIAAHIFRHTLASQMLQQGANLREISEILRHRAYSSTEVYAKIDMSALKEVVRPWPVKGGAR